MLTRPSLRPAIVVGVVVAATAWFVTRAGDLNPPKGPVQPTMVSLEDLYNRIGTQQTCPECVWQYKYVSRDTLPTNAGQVVVGSGVLHALVLNGVTGERITVFNHKGSGSPPATTTIVRTDNNRGFGGTFPQSLALDVRFSDGLYVTGNDLGGGEGFTLIYRLDP